MVMGKMLVDAHSVDIQAVGSISDVHRFLKRKTIGYYSQSAILRMIKHISFS